jgi:hypothetical protein
VGFGQSILAAAGDCGTRLGAGKADALFLAGMDWDALPRASHEWSPKPVINLIQGFRHADPQHRLYQFLANRAIRICVSPELADAVRGTGRANGPVHTIPNGMDLKAIQAPLPAQDRVIDLLIAGSKDPGLALELATHFRRQSLKVECLTEALPRPAFLEG